MTIDMVIAYVDNTDPIWQKAFIDYCTYHNLRNKIADLHTERYEDIGLINYQLKLINKNMPFINKIYLLLMNKGQEPKNLPSNVEVIYHAQFIPQRFLPTFNSTTIEMFLWNLPKVSEHFIYANDDMLPFKEMKATDFFTESGKCKIEWWEEDLTQLATMFRRQCYNSYYHTLVRLHKKVEPFKYIRPAHSMTPLIKSHCKEAFDLISDLVVRHIRAFRTEYQYNQYIYPIYEKYVYGTDQCDIDFKYTQCEDGIDLNHDIVCLNIIPKKYEKDMLIALEKSL